MKKVFKYLIVVFVSIVLVTVGINASDNLGNISDSIIGRIFSLEEKGPCGVDMVFVPTASGGFCIDKYEVSAGDDCTYNNPSTQRESRFNIDNARCQPVSEEGRKPWRYISQNQAQMACAKVGKRLASNKEWNMAALGTPDYFEENKSRDCHISKNWDEQPGLTGSGLDCKSLSGVYDMIGNVWEWTSETSNNGKVGDIDLPEQGFVASVDGEGLPSKTASEGDENYYDDYFWIKDSGVRGIARGGYWDNKEKAGVFSVYAVLEPSFVGSGVGFRCAK